MKKAPGYGRLDRPTTEIIERYRAVESATAIGVSAQVIRERLIEAGVERRRPGTHRRPAPRPKERQAGSGRAGANRHAVEQFLRQPEAEGMTQQEIADACKVDQSYVSTIA